MVLKVGERGGGDDDGGGDGERDVMSEYPNQVSKDTRLTGLEQKRKGAEGGDAGEVKGSTICIRLVEASGGGSNKLCDTSREFVQTETKGWRQPVPLSLSLPSLSNRWAEDERTALACLPTA